MRIRVGTSGFSFPKWRGAFYPRELPSDEYLTYFASKLEVVEINNTFYRTPRAEMLQRWRTQVPPDFVFVLKASRRITHQGRLTDFDSLAFFLERARALEDQLGPVLFQLPPTMRRDDDRLGAFLEALPADGMAALEFRHPSWQQPEVHALLRARGVALVAFDGEGPKGGLEITPTASWGYLRLHRPGYSEAELQELAARIRAQPWSAAYAFFSHEDDASGARHAMRLRAILAGEGAGRDDGGSGGDRSPGGTP